MNRILILLILFTCANELNAQFGQNHAIYLSSDLSLGNYIGIDENLNYTYKEKYSLKVGFSGHLRKPKSQPEDYSGGLLSVLSFGMINPFDQLLTYHIAFGRIFMLNESETIRLNAAIGIGYTTIVEPRDWHRGTSFIAPNYGWEYKEYKRVSLIINPKIEFPVTRIVGLSVSPMIQVNTKRTYFGIGIGSMLGLLKKKLLP